MYIYLSCQSGGSHIIRSEPGSSNQILTNLDNVSRDLFLRLPKAERIVPALKKYSETNGVHITNSDRHVLH